MKNIYISILLLLILSCGKDEKKGEEITNTQTNSNLITVTNAQFEGEKMALGTITQLDFNNSVKVNGLIDVPPHNKSNVTTFKGGYITKTPLLVGDIVKKGQLLVTLENTEFVEIQQNYLEVAEQLNYLKSEFERQKTLFNENITSQKNYLKAESTYKSNLAHYNGLKKTLQMMNINPKRVEQGLISSSINLYAPIDGHVTKVNVSNGNYVSPSDIIMEIVDIDHIHLELSVFEKDIMKVKKGQQIRFKIPEASNETFLAEVHLVGTTIDEQTRRVKVHGHIEDDEKENFIVGMFVDANIMTSTSKSLGLPKEAIVEEEDHTFVLVLDNKNNDEYHFKKVMLNLGQQTENNVEILNPEVLKDKQILIKGIGMLLNENDGAGHGH